MNKGGKESIEDMLLIIIKIGLALFAGYLILKALQGV